jgi:hypothetical protein
MPDELPRWVLRKGDSMSQLLNQFHFRAKAPLCLAVILSLICIPATAVTGAFGAFQTIRSNAPPHQATNPVRQLGAPVDYGALPLSFEANLGQTNQRVKFLARSAGLAFPDCHRSRHGFGESGGPRKRQRESRTA